MTGTELAAIIVAVCSIGALLLMVYLAMTMRASMQSMQRAMDTLVSETIPVVNDLRSTVMQANGQLEKTDSLLDTASSIGGTVDSASRLAYLALSNPVIKAMAFASGTARAAKRFRGSGDAE